MIPSKNASEIARKRLMQPRILLYQTDDAMNIIEYLEYNGFTVIHSTDESILTQLGREQYDLCILDHYVEPKPENLDLIYEAIRLERNIPILMLSQVYEVENVIKAINAGADDYIIKPYNFDELLCRIRALLRRYGIKMRKFESIFTLGEYVYNAYTRELALDGYITQLRPKEGKILAMLCAYMNEVVTLDMILKYVWGDTTHYTKRTFDVTLCRLRKLLNGDPAVSLITRPNIGYELQVNAEGKNWPKKMEQDELY